MDSNLLLRLLKRAARSENINSASGALERPKKPGSAGMRRDRVALPLLIVATILIRGES